MLTLHQTRRRKWKIMLLVGAVLGGLVSFPSAFAAERERAILFLSVEDLQRVLSRPSSFTLPTYQRLAPRCRVRSSPKPQRKRAPWCSVSAGARVWGSIAIPSWGRARCRAVWQSLPFPPERTNRDGTA